MPDGWARAHDLLERLLDLWEPGYEHAGLPLIPEVFLAPVLYTAFLCDGYACEVDQEDIHHWYDAQDENDVFGGVGRSNGKYRIRHPKHLVCALCVVWGWN